MLRILLALSMSFNTMAFAQQKQVKEEDRLSYPELEVTPRASERLEIEAKREDKKKWFALGAIQFSSLMTILASNQAEVSEDLDSADPSDAQTINAYDDYQQDALILGSAWFLLAAAVSGAYRPYRSGFNEIKDMPAKTKREQLTRERLAEESLYGPSKMAETLKWLSVLTQGFINYRLISDGNDTAKSVAGVATLAALAPLAFESRWVSVARNHKMYKKKIYGPLGTAILMPQENGKFALGYGITYSF